MDENQEDDGKGTAERGRRIASLLRTLPLPRLGFAAKFSWVKRKVCHSLGIRTKSENWKEVIVSNETVNDVLQQSPRIVIVLTQIRNYDDLRLMIEQKLQKRR